MFNRDINFSQYKMSIFLTIKLEKVMQERNLIIKIEESSSQISDIDIPYVSYTSPS